MENRNSKFKTDLVGRCYTFGIAVIRLSDTLPNKRSSWVLADQLIRSATSVGANLVEGKASSSRLEFKRFYEIALKSANESRYWLSMMKDVGLAPSQEIEKLLAELHELTSMIAAGVMKLKGNRS